MSGLPIGGLEHSAKSNANVCMFSVRYILLQIQSNQFLAKTNRAANAKLAVE